MRDPLSVPVLDLPGLWNSGPEHWQSYWERQDPSIRRVEQDDWNAPRIGDWIGNLNAAVDALDEPAVLCAHSSACALVAHWARQASPAQVAKVRGALLVAPSDPDAPSYPTGPGAPQGFSPMPLDRLPFPSIVVASRDDEYIRFGRAEEFARAWGSRLVDAGAAGHLNSASGLGPWPSGYALLNELRGGAPAPDVC